MILGIGTDIVSIDRISSAIRRSQGKIFDKILSNDEKVAINNFYDNRRGISYLSKRFAAKEAFAKAIGLGIGRGVNFTDISILNDEKGKPILKNNEKIVRFLKNHFLKDNFNIHFSISDEKEYALAFCVIESL